MAGWLPGPNERTRWPSSKGPTLCQQHTAAVAACGQHNALKGHISTKHPGSSLANTLTPEKRERHHPYTVMFALQRRRDRDSLCRGRHLQLTALSWGDWQSSSYLRVEGTIPRQGGWYEFQPVAWHQGTKHPRRSGTPVPINTFRGV